MKSYLAIAVAGVVANAAFAAAPRTLPLHYRPNGEGSVECVDGNKLYNRALYGARSGFRVECSDIPAFGIYLPRMGGNLSLTLPEGQCIATYTPGKMNYQQGGVEVEAQVLRSDDAAVWSIRNNGDKTVEIPVVFGGVADKGFSRNGDLGVDPPDCFELKPTYCEGNIFTVDGGNITVEYGKKERKLLSLFIPATTFQIDSLPVYHGVITLNPQEVKYIALTPPESSLNAQTMNIPSVLNQAESERMQLANTLTISTPDDFINPIGNALAVAADGIWSGEAWLHGAIGWRTPHLGWRGAYIADALGWYDRANTHFSTYAANQVTEVPPVLPHPTQDPEQAWARAEKKWGTQMYSNGYICRRPGKNNEMSHYDMNLVYADALCRHLIAVGDTGAMRRYYPVLKSHLDWEKRNFDPDGNGLYDGYCCIWASDALYYGGGAATHSTAYNIFALEAAAQIAEALGEKADAAQFEKQAQTSRQAMENNHLWQNDQGVWGEYQEYFNKERIHNSPAVWTVYHAIDSRLGNGLQKYAATKYIDREIPKVPFTIEGDTARYHTISTTSWMPYSWSINNVAMGEVMHTALAYWQADRPDEAFALMKSAVMDNMYTGACPLNFGQISQFDAARGECYRDFADPIGVWGRALVEGLYGITPNAFDGTVTITPGFPSSWDHASISLSQIKYSFRRENNQDVYAIEPNYPNALRPVLKLPVFNRIKSVKCNGKEIAFENDGENSFNRPRITISPEDGCTQYTIVVETGEPLQGIALDECQVVGPCIFTTMADGELKWKEVAEKVQPTLTQKFDIPDNLDAVDWTKCHKLDISQSYNAKVSDIFQNEYRSPRPAVTTLQIPINGLGEWCHPISTADIKDPQGKEGNNIAFTSLWDNYPDSLDIKLDASADEIFALVAGSTNHMQCLMPNAEILLLYEDGTSQSTTLLPPLNYAPIEQDYYVDGIAFAIPDNRKPPMRVHLPTGKMSRSLGDELGISGVDGRRIEGGAGVMVQLNHSSNKRINGLRIKALAPDIVVGLMDVRIK